MEPPKCPYGDRYFRNQMLKAASRWISMRSYTISNHCNRSDQPAADPNFRLGEHSSTRASRSMQFAPTWGAFWSRFCGAENCWWRAGNIPRLDCYARFSASARFELHR